MTKLYLFPGLGVDEIVFRELDFSGYEPVFIRWITPEKQEPIERYALRLSKQIIDQNPILIGLSFGGMMAVEVAKYLPDAQLILIASAKNRGEIPAIYLLSGKLRLDRLLPASLMKRSNFMTNRLFGTSTHEEKELLREILRRTDTVFLKWAIGRIVNWKNETFPENTIHIHGTKDRLLPFRNVINAIPVKGGGHFMTLSKAGEISVLLHQLLGKK